MTEHLVVQSSRGAYSVAFHASIEDVQQGLAQFITQRGYSSVLLFSNPTVFGLYGQRVVETVRSYSRVETILFDDGEEYKNLRSIQRAIEELEKMNLDRRCVFVALGGGVVGDMTGFLSSIYLRGVDWIQIPTTLLAMVDSSVGGKTGVNLASGKNRIGTFYPPNFVTSSSVFLQTLDPEEVQAGFGEVLKHAVLHSEVLVAEVMNAFEQESWSTEDQASSLPSLLINVCRVKADIVQVDELEKGRRALLNFGHSIGHAIERCLGFGTMRHGIAVLIGMYLETAWTYSKGWTTIGVVHHLESFLKRLDMSIFSGDNIDVVTMFDAISFDKKMQCDKLQMVVVHDFGQAHLSDLNRDEIEDLVAFSTERLLVLFTPNPFDD